MSADLTDVGIAQKLRFMAEDGAVDVASLRRAADDIDRLRQIAELARKARWLHGACFDLANGSGCFITTESMRRFDEVFDALAVALGDLVDIDEDDEKAMFEGPAKLLERAKVAEAEAGRLRAELAASEGKS